MSNIHLGQSIEAPSLHRKFCLVEGCAGLSVWKPVMMVKPTGWRFMLNPDPLLIPHDGFLCEKHKDVGLNQLLNREEKDQIERHLQEQKVHQPDWATAKVGVMRVKAKA